MTPSKITYLGRVEIKNLWGEFDISWQLDPQVNILLGINGSGKTTLLGIINSIVNKRRDIERYKFDEVTLRFNDQNFIAVKRIARDELLEKLLKGEADESVPKAIKAILENKAAVSAYQISAVSAYQITGSFSKEMTRESHEAVNFADVISIRKISTFDMSCQAKRKTEGNEGGVTENEGRVVTELDKLLSKLIVYFKGYQLKLRNLEREQTSILDQKIRELSSKNNSNNAELRELKKALHHKEVKVEEIYRQKNQFLKELNQLFAGTHKIVDFDKDNSLVFHKNDKMITPYQLSAGEKQILIILLTVVLQENKPFVLLMDEPELSLHLPWQFQLVDLIRRLNENCQIIIATHAPGIFSKGWRDKIIKMEEIISSSNH